MEYFQYISLFMGPTLKRIEIKIFSEDMYRTFWDVLRHYAPAIHEICIEVAQFEPSDPALKSQSRALRSFTHLRWLFCSECRMAANKAVWMLPEHLAYLSSIPTLRVVQFRLLIRDLNPSETADIGTSDVLFPSLAVLEVHLHDSDTLNYLCQCVEQHKLSELKTIHLYLYTQPLAMQFQRFFRSITDKSLLADFAVIITDTRLPTSSSYIVTDVTIMSLFALRLVVFALINVPHMITKDSLCRMAPAWPTLKTLCLYCPGVTSIFDTIHVRNFGLLADKLPRLNEVSLRGLDMKVTDNQEFELQPICHHSRRPVTLNIMDSKLPDSFAQARIAAYLTAIFPNVQIEGQDPGIEGFKKLVGLLNEVRRSERNSDPTSTLRVTSPNEQSPEDGKSMASHVVLIII